MNVTLLSRLRRARWVHGLQLLVFTCWVANPFPGAFSYWTDTNGDRVKEEVANPPEGDSWFDQDSDGDSLTNSQEAVFGSDPYQIDADFNGLTDQIERDYADPSAPFDPWNWDSDGDGYSDHDEFYQRLWGWQPQINYLNLTPGGFYSYADADGDGTKNPEDWDFNVDRDNDGTVNWQDGSPSFNGVGGMYMDDANNGVWQDPGVWIGGNWYPSGTVDSDMDGTPDHLDVYPWGSFWYNGTEYGGSWQDSDYDSIPDAADAWPYDANNGQFYYNGSWYSGSWQDSDSDGIPDVADGWPYDSSNGANYYYNPTYDYNGTTYYGYWSDSDNDGVPDPADSHSWNNSLWTDFDNDGRIAAEDSHPQYSWLWSDWNFNWSNNDNDGDEDGIPDARDSHPRESWRWNDWNNDGSNDDPSSDFDGDGRTLENDSHPANGSLWSDWNFNGTNNDANGDEDAREDAEDSHPRDPNLWSDWNGNGTNNDSDGDEDGTADAEDSHPRFNGLRSDWNGDGDDNDGDWDEDGIANGSDSHPRDGGVSSDFDGDGRNEADDSHPQNNSLWSDWDSNGVNNDADGDEDGWGDGSDSHPRQNHLWNDFDGDGVNLDHDSDPQNNSLWSDWNHNGTNNDADWDEDNVPNENDSSPYVALLWSDWDQNGVNNDSDGDEDGAADGLDSHPRNAAFWGDWNYDGQNDGPQDNSDGDARDNGTDSDPLNAALWSDWNHDGDNNDADADEDGYVNEDDSHPFDPALSTDWNGDGDNNEADMDEDGRMNEHTAADGSFVSNQDSHPHDAALWSDWDGNGTNNDTDGDEDGVLDANDSHPFHAHLWSDWDFNQTNNDTDGDEDGVIDSQDSDPRNNALKSDWNHDGDDNESDWDEDGHDNGSDSHPTDSVLWADYDGDNRNSEDDSDPADGSLWSDWNHDGDNHATDGDEDGQPDYADSDPRNPDLWIDWNHDGYNDGSEPADRDGDGLFDNVDNYPDDPYNNADSDSDGLTDYDEVILHGTERFDVDSDDDFLTDYEELLVYHTNPLAQRTNASQSIVDGYLFRGQDSDGDGLPDLLEDHYGLNKNDYNDAAGDLDGDGVSNLQAYQGGWSLTVYLDTFDADGDRITDAVEDRWAAVAAGSLDKNNFDDAVGDFDGDGVMNFEEIKLGLSVTQAVSTRSDGLSDLQVLAWALQLGDYRREADYVQAAWEQVQLPDHAHRYLLMVDFGPGGSWASTYSNWCAGLANFATQFTPPVPQRLHAADADGDGMSNVWEYRHRLNPRSVHDGGYADMLYTPENLPVMQSFEAFAETWTDYLSVNEAYQWYQQSFQREVAAWALIDPDGDTLSNLKEFQLGTNPRIADTDGDGASDLVEMQAGTNPTLAGGGTFTGGSTGGTGGSGTTTGSGSSGSTAGGGSTTTGGTSTGGGSTTGGGTSGGTPPDAEAVVVSRGAHAGLGSETRQSVRLEPFDTTGLHRYSQEAQEKYDEAKEDAEEITVDEPPHEVAVRWEFSVETGMGMERREHFGTEAEAQAAKDAQSPEGGSDPQTNDKPWQWRLIGKKQTSDGPAEVRQNYTRKSWDAPPEVFKSADELEEMTADAPAGWAEEILQPPGSPLGPEQWMTRTEKETSAQGRWVTTEEGGEGSGPRFPEGAAVEVRLKRVDVSAEAMQQRVTRTFLRITQTVDDDPETEDAPPVVAPVTLTIEPGQKVSTTGTGPGAANGCVVLLGRPPENKTATMTDQLVPLQMVSRDKYFAGSLQIPAGWEKLGLEFGTEGEDLGKHAGFDGMAPEPGKEPAKVFSSLEALLEEGALEQQPMEGENTQEQKVWFVREGGRLNWYTCFNSLGNVQLKIHFKDTVVCTLEHELKTDQSFAGWITYVDQWVKGTSFQWDVPLENLPLPTQTLASVIAAGPAAADAGMTALAAGNALLSGAVLTTETNVPLAPQSLAVTLGEPVADLSELGNLSTVRVLPLETLNLQPALTLDPNTVYWLAGNTLTPLTDAQVEALLPQAGSVTLGVPIDSGASGAGANQNQNPPANNGAPSSNVPADDLDNMTRACLIPIFLVISQVEGMEAVTRGALDGFKSGVEDDYQMLMLLKKGLIFVGGLTEQGMSDIASWKTDRKKRATAILALAGHISEEFVFKPIREFHQEISTWEGFKRRAFITMQAAYELQKQFVNAHIQAFTVAKDNAPKLVDAMTSWMDDFSNRMLVQSEGTVFANAAWNKDTLVGDFMEQNRYVCYTFGHTFGYIVEQVLSGVVQAGVGKIASVLAKGTAKLAGNVLKRSAFAVAGKMHVLKQYLAGVWSRSEMGFVQISIGNAAKQPVNATAKKTLAEELEEQLARAAVINRDVFNTRKILATIAEGANLKRLVATQAGKDAVWQRLSLLTHLMGEQADETLMTNFLKVMDQKLIYDIGGQPVDWADDFLRAFRGTPSSFVNRAPLDSFSDSAKLRLKEFLSEPFPGYAWTFEDEITENWKEPIVRGILVELDQFYKGGLKAAGWTHLPQREAVDFLDPTGFIAKQVKSLGTVNSATLEKMKTALKDLADFAPGSGRTKLVLEIHQKPGIASQVDALRNTLESYLNSGVRASLPEGTTLKIEVFDYEFIPKP